MAGDTYRDHDGELHAVVSATIIMKCADGTERNVALEQRAGGQWWIPANNVNAAKVWED